MTFTDLQSEVLDELNMDIATASTAARTRVKRHLNDVHRRLLTEPAMTRLARDVTDYTFASVASTAQYGMPSGLARLNGIHDRTNRYPLAQRDLGWLRTVDPDLTSGAPPSSVYVPVGWWPVQKQPADASDIYVRSSSAADTTQTCYIEGLTSTGQLWAGSATLTGATEAKLNGTQTLTHISKVYLSAAAAGIVTIYEDTGTTKPLAVLLIGALSVRHYAIQLWPTPTSAVTYYVDYTREIPEMVQGTDTPLLPPDFHYLLAVGAKMKEFRRADDSRVAPLQQEWFEGIARLKHWMYNNADFGLNTEGLEVSRYGAFFPAGPY